MLRRLLKIYHPRTQTYYLSILFYRGLSGTVLGVILFLIFFNGAASRPAIPRPSWPLLPRTNNNPVAIKLKFVDDLSVAMRVRLNKDLMNTQRQLPATFEERYGTTISDRSNEMQRIVDSLNAFAEEGQMVINTDKSLLS